MVPPAPATVSITTVWPSGTRIASAITRAVVSVEPPGGNGEISVTGRVGNDCAAAMPNHAAAATLAISLDHFLFLPMKPKVYGIRNCDTMKKAFAWLDERKVAYDFHDYKKEGIGAPKLKEWAARTGWERLANTRGPTWRKIPDAQTAGLTEARALALLAQNPSAIRRPIVEQGTKLLVGFDPAEFDAAF